MGDTYCTPYNMYSILYTIIYYIPYWDSCVYVVFWGPWTSKPPERISEALRASREIVLEAVVRARPGHAFVRHCSKGFDPNKGRRGWGSRIWCLGFRAYRVLRVAMFQGSAFGVVLVAFCAFSFYILSVYGLKDFNALHLPS